MKPEDEVNLDVDNDSCYDSIDVYLSLDIPVDDKDSQNLDFTRFKGPEKGAQDIADMLWLHSLLRFHSGDFRGSTEKALQKSIAALYGEVRRPWMKTISLRYAIAASIIFFSLTFLWQESVPSAQTLIAKAYENTLVLLDREYRLVLSRNQEDLHATLLVRGDKAFRLTLEEHGPVASFGGYEDEFWVASRLGPVYKSDSRFAFARWLENRRNGSPFLEPTTVLKRIRNGYDLKRETDRLPDGRTLWRVVATLNTDIESNGLNWPEKVYLWIDADNWRVEKIVVQWVVDEDALQGEPTLKAELLIEFLGESEDSIDSYRCEALFKNRLILVRDEVFFMNFLQ